MEEFEAITGLSQTSKPIKLNVSNQDTDKNLITSMPPKSSREVTIEVTRRGKAKPKASLN